MEYYCDIPVDVKQGLLARGLTIPDRYMGWERGVRSHFAYNSLHAELNCLRL